VSIAVDADVLVRYLTWDDATQADAAAMAIEAADAVAISLKRAYRYRSEQTADAIQRIIESRNVQLDRLAAEVGLRMLRRDGDFGDAATSSHSISTSPA
jgi:predicted nucleic-acid-binding protein